MELLSNVFNPSLAFLAGLYHLVDKAQDEKEVWQIDKILELWNLIIRKRMRDREQETGKINAWTDTP